MSSVGIDSMILVYAGIVPANTEQHESVAELKLRSRLLLHQLIKRKATIVLPSIAVSELLVPVPPERKGELLAALSKRFECPFFDLHAASIASEIWSGHKKLSRDQKYDKRKVLKADAMIIASAKAAGATHFYSHDKKCRTLANLVMTAHDLPTSDPDDMFLVDDIRRGDDKFPI